MLVLVLLAAIRGYLRGTVAQVFVVVGLVAGFYVALSVSRWMGTHWSDARPAALYLVLRWVVSVLVGLALATAFRWWGTSLAKAVREGPLSWVDRGVGMMIGVVIGSSVCVLGLLGALQFEQPNGPGALAAQARAGIPAMGAAAAVCGFGESFVPGCRWLRKQFEVAQERAIRLRADGQ